MECPNCGSSDVKERFESTIEAGNKTFLVIIPGLHCQECGEMTCSDQTMRSVELAVAMQLVSRDSLSGKDHRCCRLTLAIKRDIMAKLYGVSEECLLELEKLETPVPESMHVYIARRVRLDYQGSPEAQSIIPRHLNQPTEQQSQPSCPAPC